MNSFLRKIILFLIIAVSGGATFNYLANQINIFLLFLVLFLYFTSSKVILKDYFTATLISVLSFSSILVLNFFLSDFYINPLDTIKISVRFFILSLLILYYKNNNISIEKDLFVVLIIFLFHAILNYILITFFKGYFTVFNIVGTRRVYSFYRIFYYLSAYGEEDSTIRNQGFFWEPGVLQIYLNFLLFISIKLKKYLIAILSILTIITTFSTAGFIIMFVILANSLLSRKSVLNIIIISTLMLSLFPLIKNNILEKTVSSSSHLRKYDFEQAWIITKNFPLKGIGYLTKDYNKLKLNYYAGGNDSDYQATINRGNTNSVMYAFMSFGIIIGLLFFIFIFFQDLFDNKFIIFFIVVLANFSEPLLFSNFFLLFLSSGMINVNRLFLYKNL